jgi:hypothetical protein
MDGGNTMANIIEEALQKAKAEAEKKAAESGQGNGNVEVRVADTSSLKTSSKSG